MRILVTGGTGFVGSHTVAALIEAGHEVRLLVRKPERIGPALRPLGITVQLDHVVGDITDPELVKRAVTGCDAVLHAAAVFSLDARRYREITATNLAGAETVLRHAADAGCDPVVHVSSTAALLRRAPVTPDSPLSPIRSAYIRSKVASEAVARRLQADGAPVVVVQPGGVLGPHDPHLSDQVRRVRDILRGLYPMWPSGGYHVTDVREVARVHAAVMRSGAGPRRYAVPGNYLDGREMFAVLREVTGRRLPYVTLPAGLVSPMAWAASAAQRVLPFHVPAEYEGVVILRQRMRVDDSRAREELGVSPRPVRETFADLVEWLHRAGHITTRQAGAAAG